MNKSLVATLSLLFGSCVYASSYSVSISADTTRFDYAETDDYGALLDTERADFGKVNGVTLSLTPLENGLYLGASYVRGNTDYVGSLLYSSDPYGSYRGTTMNEVGDYTFGYKSTVHLDKNGQWKMPIMFGVGYRRWVRQLGYDEVYDWGYYDVGIGLHYALSSTMSIGLDGNYRKAFNAQMHENLNGYTFDLKNVHGYKISVPLELALSDSLSTFISYNYEYWNIDASDSVGGFYEPDSETKNETLSLGLKLKF